MEYIESREFLELADNLPIIDVRSPGEFIQGHIPGAINIALFSDEERAQVGTIYKGAGRLSSVRKGLEIVGPKMVQLIDRALELSKDGNLLVHCWRGGMRSESMGWLFETAGIKCKVLSGGYKSYRKFVRENLTKGKEILVLGGLTGSGKTLLLNEMLQKGEPVIDLEKLAAHKGSAFGGIGQESQPSTEQFENNLFKEVNKIEESYFWVEDESLQIGKIFIPEPFFAQMLSSKLVFIEVPDDYRIRVLVTDYANQDSILLEEAIFKLKQRLGNLATQEAVEALRNSNYPETARILLGYYDKTYQYGLNRRDKNLVYRLDLTITAEHSYSQTIIELKDRLLKKSI